MISSVYKKNDQFRHPRDTQSWTYLFIIIYQGRRDLMMISKPFFPSSFFFLFILITAVAAAADDVAFDVFFFFFPFVLFHPFVV